MAAAAAPKDESLKYTKAMLYHELAEKKRAYFKRLNPDVITDHLLNTSPTKQIFRALGQYMYGDTLPTWAVKLLQGLTASKPEDQLLYGILQYKRASSRVAKNQTIAMLDALIQLPELNIVALTFECGSLSVPALFEKFISEIDRLKELITTKLPPEVVLMLNSIVADKTGLSTLVKDSDTGASEPERLLAVKIKSIRKAVEGHIGFEKIITIAAALEIALSSFKKIEWQRKLEEIIKFTTPLHDKRRFDPYAFKSFETETKLAQIAKMYELVEEVNVIAAIGMKDAFDKLLELKGHVKRKIAKIGLAEFIVALEVLKKNLDDQPSLVEIAGVKLPIEALEEIYKIFDQAVQTIRPDLLSGVSAYVFRPAGAVYAASGAAAAAGAGR